MAWPPKGAAPVYPERRRPAKESGPRSGGTATQHRQNDAPRLRERPQVDPDLGPRRPERLDRRLRSDVSRGPGSVRTATDAACAGIKRLDPQLPGRQQVLDRVMVGVVKMERQSSRGNRRQDFVQQLADLVRNRLADRVSDRDLID